MQGLLGRVPIAARALSFLAAMLLAFAAVAVADDDQQTNYNVQGTVTASDGAPIAGATVTLTSQNGSHTERTSKDGRFGFSLAPGTYVLVANAPGYGRLSQRTVTVGMHTELTLTLSPATTGSLLVIGNVEANAGDTVSSASAPSRNLSAQAAAAQGVTAVSDIVWSQLSVTPVIPLGGGSNATASFAVRGPDPTETLVDIDGHQVNNGNTGDFDLSLLDPAALQNVQVIYGISPSSLLGPNQIGGAINVQTLSPTIAQHSLVRGFVGSFNSVGGTLQTTGTVDRWGYAFSLHDASSAGSVNQSLLAIAPPGAAPPSKDKSIQYVGSGFNDDSMLGKLRYQLGGSDGYGYLQLSFRGQSVYKDDSALLTNYTPPHFSGDTGDVVPAPGNSAPFDDDSGSGHGGYQSFAGTTLEANQFNYGFDAQLPLGDARVAGAPATMLQFSHLTSLNSQSVNGPGEATLPYLYNQRDSLIDDWLQIDHHFPNGDLTFKYDLGTESLTTNYVQGQVTAEIARLPGFPVTGAFVPFDDDDDGGAPTQVENVAQVQRSAVLRYQGDPTSQIHYSLEGYLSNFSTFGTSFDPRVGFVWTPTGNSVLRASVGTTFQVPQLSELVVPPLEDRVRLGGVVFIGNPNLQPDHATDFDLGGEQIFGARGHQLHLSVDLYQTNLRSPANQLNVNPVPNCDPNTVGRAKSCPLSYPVNASNGIYRGIDVDAEQQLGPNFRLRAGWDVDSSYLTVIPANIQDGTLVPNEQSLGQPLHKAYFGFDCRAAKGLNYGAQVNWEGTYNELNLSPYATLDAHVAYRTGSVEFGLYGTNLTSAYSQPFAVVGGGVPYGTLPTFEGEPQTPIFPVANVLQGAKVVFVVTKSI